jgi:CoA:oxalate CoA-transferase
VRWPAPTLGQHNHQVYNELLGMPDEEIAALEQAGVIGTKPTGSRII